MSQSLKITLVAVAALLLSACAGQTGLRSADFQRYQYTAIGSAVGALAGGVIGHQFDDDDGRYYGAAAGALLGGAIGNNMDQMRARDAAAPYRNPNNYPSQDSRYSYNNGAYVQPPPASAQPYPYY